MPLTGPCAGPEMDTFLKFSILNDEIDNIKERLKDVDIDLEKASNISNEEIKRIRL